MRECERCGERLNTGEARVVVALTADELETLAFATADEHLAGRLACALGLIDVHREMQLRREHPSL